MGNGANKFQDLEKLAQEYWEYLVNHLYAEYYFDRLISEGALTHDDVEQIKKISNPTKKNMARQMLNRIRYKGPGVGLILALAIENEQSHIIQHIEAAEKEKKSGQTASPKAEETNYVAKPVSPGPIRDQSMSSASGTCDSDNGTPGQHTGQFRYWPGSGGRGLGGRTSSLTRSGPLVTTSNKIRDQTLSMPAASGTCDIDNAIRVLNRSGLVVKRWNTLLTNLGLTDGDIQTFSSMTRGNPQRCIEQGVRQWYDSSPDHTVDLLVAAVDACDCGRAADELKGIVRPSVVGSLTAAVNILQDDRSVVNQCDVLLRKLDLSDGDIANMKTASREPQRLIEDGVKQWYNTSSRHSVQALAEMLKNCGFGRAADSITSQFSTKMAPGVRK